MNKMPEIKLIDTNAIRPNPDNPRQIDVLQFDKLKKSLQEFPDMLLLKPLILDKDNVVLGGNMRLKALQELGIKKVPVIYADSFTEDQKKEFMIKDNIGYGKWDYDLLANVWDADVLKDWGMELAMFDPIEDSDFNIDYVPPEKARENDVEVKKIKCPSCGYEM